MTIPPNPHPEQVEAIVDAIELDLLEGQRGNEDTYSWVRRIATAASLANRPADDGERYLVWSNENQAWWGVNHCGYTRIIDRAGRYSRAEALLIAGTRDGGWHVRKGNPDEIAMLERDAIDQYAEITASQAALPLQPEGVKRP